MVFWRNLHAPPGNKSPIGSLKLGGCSPPDLVKVISNTQLRSQSLRLPDSGLVAGCAGRKDMIRKKNQPWNRTIAITFRFFFTKSRDFFEMKSIIPVCCGCKFPMDFPRVQRSNDLGFASLRIPAVLSVFFFSCFLILFWLGQTQENKHIQ